MQSYFDRVKLFERVVRALVIGLAPYLGFAERGLPVYNLTFVRRPVFGFYAISSTRRVQIVVYKHRRRLHLGACNETLWLVLIIHVLGYEITLGCVL